MTSVMSILRGLNGSWMLLGRSVDMPFILLCLLGVPRLLIFYEILPVSVNIKFDGVSTHVDHTSQQQHLGEFWLVFVSHHKQIICVLPSKHSVESEGGPPCSSMPWRCGVGRTKWRVMASRSLFGM